MRFLHVHLNVGAAHAADQQRFYATTLGLDTHATSDGFTITAGETELSFASGPGEPFYHFALLVPGDRFDAALEWIATRAPLLPRTGSSELVFDFPAWDARACYFHDPAGNIVELIAHSGREHDGRHGSFRPEELVGLSELGLVGTPTELAPPLTDELDLPLWDGRVADADALAFIGEQARTLILVPEGRGWLPTGRPGERHPAQVEIEAGSAPPKRAELDGGRYRIAVRPD